MFDLTGMTALVTGASGGLGSGIAEVHPGTGTLAVGRGTGQHAVEQRSHHPGEQLGGLVACAVQLLVGGVREKGGRVAQVETATSLQLQQQLPQLRGVP